MTAPADSETTALVTFTDLVDLLTRAFVRHGASPNVAAVLAQNCAAAERDGATSHGIFRMQGYISTLKSGWVDGQATPVLEAASDAVLLVDAANGFAQPALAAALPWARLTARAKGIALIAIRRSHHHAALWLDVEPLAEDGFVAITFVNSLTKVVPHGGREPLYGTNPMAFAAPRLGSDTLTFDQASSAVAWGEVRVAARAGHPLLPGIGVDKSGAPTTDPAAVLDGGALLPFGGHKGSAIAMMVEIMAAALTGGNFSFEIDHTGFPGAETSCSGQTLILIDPVVVAGQAFTDRIEQLVTQLEACGQERMPGDRRHANRKANASGIPLRKSILDDLVRLAEIAVDA